ncbi:MAG: CoA-transferase subunit beta [Gammaproteobacteria bacterium]|nr:CoA-transferase subunit beta [Gammaproteobacteria bacterium]
MTTDWQSSPVATDYAVDELMITTLAGLFKNGDQACNGMASFIPVSAFMLARLTHAPDLVWLASAAGLDPRPDRVPASTLEAPLWRDSVMYIEQYGDFWNLALNGRWIQKFCVGAAQLDRYGNANNSVIGDDYDRPQVRLPGTAGLADMGSIGKQLYFWNPNHSPRSLVEKVDFISAAGYLDGGDARERLGLEGGPEVVITNLAVMDFHPVSKQMRLQSVHPGVTVATVQKATGFELLMPEGSVPETAPPTEAQVRLIREVIDPDNMRKRGFRGG